VALSMECPPAGAEVSTWYKPFTVSLQQAVVKV